MSETGISSSDARRIAKDVAGKVESRLERLIHRVDSRVDHLDGEVARIRQEMSEIANSINRMAQTLSSQLSELKTTATKQVATTGKLLTTNQMGFTANTAAVALVQSSTEGVKTNVANNTSALVEMEYLRLYNEARAPIRFISGFGEEIDERFLKAVETVALNRDLYDDHFERIYDESDNKVRTIGSHIFQVLEEDFMPTVEARLTVPRSEFIRLPLAIDEKHIEVRNELLDGVMDSLGGHVLEPLLQKHHAFEQQLANDFSCESSTPEGMAFVPVAVTVRKNHGVEYLTDASVESGSNDGTPPTLTSSNSLGDVLTKVAQHESEIVATATKLGQKQLSSLKKELAALAEAGLLASEMLPAYEAYLDAFGLSILRPGAKVSVSGG